MKYFEQARSEIVNAIALSASDCPQVLPSRYLSYFDRFGRGLRGGESIDFQHANGTVSLNSAIRKKLVRSAQVNIWTEDKALRAKIPETDLGKNSFEFELSDGTKAKAPLDDKYSDVVLDAQRAYRNGAFVLIQGIVQWDRDDHLKGFESIEHVTPLDPLDVTLRLEHLNRQNQGGPQYVFRMEIEKDATPDFRLVCSPIHATNPSVSPANSFSKICSSPQRFGSTVRTSDIAAIAPSRPCIQPAGMVADPEAGFSAYQSRRAKAARK